VIRKLQAVALDCPDPRALAEFYAALTGGKVVTDPGDEDWIEVCGFEGVTLGFQKVADYRPPRWPDPERPQQLHLDFDVSDLEADEKLALSLGATVLERTDLINPEARWRVYADPAGHPFCLCLH
jgi:predicted enzyme related to lactoylglutathione lyase